MSTPVILAQTTTSARQVATETGLGTYVATAVSPAPPAVTQAADDGAPGAPPAPTSIPVVPDAGPTPPADAGSVDAQPAPVPVIPEAVSSAAPPPRYGPVYPFSALCGNSTCNVGELCCNFSCGTCVAVGGSCNLAPCDGPSIPYSQACGMSTCDVGTVCCKSSCGLCAPADECAHVHC